ERVEEGRAPDRTVEERVAEPAHVLRALGGHLEAARLEEAHGPVLDRHADDRPERSAADARRHGVAGADLPDELALLLDEIPHSALAAARREPERHLPEEGVAPAEERVERRRPGRLRAHGADAARLLDEARRARVAVDPERLAAEHAEVLGALERAHDLARAAEGLGADERHVDLARDLAHLAREALGVALREGEERAHLLAEVGLRLIEVDDEVVDPL